MYRTRFYIVKQELKIRADERDNTQLFSKDTFYFRTAKRDSEYNSVFCEARVFKRQKTSDYYVYAKVYKVAGKLRRNQTQNFSGQSSSVFENKSGRSPKEKPTERNVTDICTRLFYINYNLILRKLKRSERISVE